MTIPDLNTAGMPQAAATVFVWLADKVLGGAKRALGWGWERSQWIAAQDRYDEQIIKQYGWIRIFGQTTPKPLKEIFTDVYMLDVLTAVRRFDKEDLRRHLWEQDRGMPFRYGERLPADQLLKRGTKFFILGKPGAGKTTFLEYLAVWESQRGRWGPCLGKIPIFVPLKQFSESGKSLFDFIVEQFGVCHFPDAAPFVEPLLKSGKALVLFDGLDEVTKAAEARDDRRGQVTQEIEQFSRQYDGCHIAVTCRIAATEYMFDPAFVYLELADFAPEQVEAFVRNWFWNPEEAEQTAGLAERMLADLGKPEHAGIRDLGRSPLLLTLLCLNYAETLSFPVRRVEIYQEALDALLKKWDSSRGIKRDSLYGSLSPGRKQQMFSRIAYDGFLQDEILFPQPDLEERLTAYLAHVPEVPDAIDIDAEAVLREIVEQHGIFAEQSRGLLSFAHLTFQEYYAAKHLAESTPTDTLDPLMARMADTRWREVFLLTASLLPDATRFPAAFEATLHRLVASRPPPLAWLNWVAEQALRSHAGYRQAATRVSYAQDLMHARMLARSPNLPAAYVLLGSPFTRDLAGDLDRDLARDWRRGLAASLDRLTFDRAMVRIIRLSRGLEVDDDGVLATIVDQLSETCQQLHDNRLNEAVSALTVPPAGAPQATREQFAAQLADILEIYGALEPFRLLRHEIHALIEEQERCFDLGSDDLRLLWAYLYATQLFHDCLQLAYTPDRRASEDRILLPPPLNEQEA